MQDRNKAIVYKKQVPLLLQHKAARLIRYTQSIFEAQRFFSLHEMLSTPISSWSWRKDEFFNVYRTLNLGTINYAAPA